LGQDRSVQEAADDLKKKRQLEIKTRVKKRPYTKGETERMMLGCTQLVVFAKETVRCREDVLVRVWKEVVGIFVNCY
jgi:hypothetical protein